jgi:hypothetical protein
VRSATLSFIAKDPSPKERVATQGRGCCYAREREGRSDFFILIIILKNRKQGALNTKGGCFAIKSLPFLFIYLFKKKESCFAIKQGKRIAVPISVRLLRLLRLSLRAFIAKDPFLLRSNHPFSSQRDKGEGGGSHKGEGRVAS